MPNFAAAEISIFIIKHARDFIGGCAEKSAILIHRVIQISLVNIGCVRNYGYVRVCGRMSPTSVSSNAYIGRDDQDALKAAVFQRLHPRLYLERYAVENFRPDGRLFGDFRSVSVNVGEQFTFLYSSSFMN